MGSFNVSCGISNLLIRPNEEIGFVILDKNRSHRMPVAKRGVAYFVHPYDALKPFLPPVYGVYGDYGSIVGIEASPTTEILESIFARPAETVLKCISSDRGLYYSAGEIYESYFAGEPDWQENRNTAYESLTRLGFAHVETNENIEVYAYGDYTMMHSPDEEWDNDFITLGPKSQWFIETADSGETVVPGFYAQDIGTVMDIFHTATGLLPGYNEEDHERVILLNGLSGMFFRKDVYFDMKKMMLESGYVSTPEQLKDSALMSLKYRFDIKEMPAFVDMRTIVYALDIMCLPLKFRDELNRYEGNDRGFESYYLTEIMRSTNRVFHPTVCGPEDGNNAIIRHLNTLTGDILTKRKA